jgi:AcrR family transcriptional regulator
MAVATPRRKGAENSETRAQLIQCAIKMLHDEGAGAVTARRLAEQVGLGRHIVHYYFGTIDEVFVAIIREETARAEAVLMEANGADDTVQLLWDNILFGAPVLLELMQLAIRHPSIALEYKNYTERFRVAMASLLEDYAQSRGIELPGTPAAVALMLQSVALTIGIERNFDLGMGHKQAEVALLDWLRSISAAPVLPS